MAALDDEERAHNITVMMEGAEVHMAAQESLQNSLNHPTAMEKQTGTFKHPKSLLRPPTVVHFPPSLDMDFNVLSKRHGSTSTPCVARTASATSVTPITPFFSDGSLNDSAIETTFSNSHRPMLSPLCCNFGSHKKVSRGKIQHLPRFGSIAESDTDLESPKAVLFPNSEICDTVQSSPDSTSDSQCIAFLPRTFYGKHQRLPKLLSPKKHDAISPSEQKISMHDLQKKDEKMDTDIPESTTPTSSSQNSLFNFTSHSQSSTDTGYESQLGFELSSSLEHSNSQSLCESVAQQCLNQFAPKNLDCLIGRKIGLDQVDIITQLFVGNKLIPLQIILSHLSRRDLKNMCAVSEHWRSAVEKNSDICKRRTSPRIKKMAQQKENCYQKKRSESRQLTTPRGLLSVVQPTATDTSAIGTTPPVISSQAQKALDLSEKYWREAENLKNEECLRKCPRCSCPSRMNPTQERAWCCNKDCNFDFCIKCHHAFHGSKDCSMTVVPKKNKSDAKVGSKRSKKNLRRL